MYIIPSEIEKFCKKVGDEVHIEVDLEDKEVIFRIVRGRYEMYGNTAVLLSGKDIMNLLELNKVLGDDGEVKKILNMPDTEKDEKIHDLIYTTVAKYALQMVNAAMGKDHFPELKALPHHKSTYFHRR